MIPVIVSLLLGALCCSICYRKAYANAKHHYFNDGWNCRGIDDARRAREKLESRRGRYGQFAPKKL